MFCFLALFSIAKADRKEANLYMQELKQVYRNKCLNLLKYRKACVLKHEQNSTAEIVDFALENK